MREKLIAHHIVCLKRFGKVGAPNANCNAHPHMLGPLQDFPAGIF
jgi:hypothetical protein